jgi:hypothetical protein
VVRNIENLDNLIKLISMIKKKQLYETVVMFLSKNIFKHEKLMNIIINYHFQTIYSKKCNGDISLVNTNPIPADKPCKRSLVAVIRLLGRCGQSHSTPHLL